MEREEGEMSDDNVMEVDESDNIVMVKGKKRGVYQKQLEKIDLYQIEERMTQFGLNLVGNRVITQKQIDELYSNFGIDSGNERHFRLDTLHLHGVNGLDTVEIFEYLEDFKPVSLEWIDSLSCNIVCQDHIMAALTLLLHSREIKNKELKAMLSDKSPHHYREGMPHPKKDLILMRYATNGDKKCGTKKSNHNPSYKEYFDQSMESSAKNPWGDLCKSWGVYDHQEFFTRKLPKQEYDNVVCEDDNEVVQIKNKSLAIRLGKKRKNGEAEDSNSDAEWKLKLKSPRMRMHADDEECKQKKKNNYDSVKDDEDTFAPLSIEVANSHRSYTPREDVKLSDKFKRHTNTTHIQKDSIHSRLGVKVVSTHGTGSSDECSSDSTNYNTMSSVQKVSNQKRSDSSVWSRLETKSQGKSDLRDILKSRKRKKNEDLRDVIGKSKSSLCIEIDNNLYK